VPGLEEAKHGSLDDDLAGRDITFPKNRVGHDHVDVKIREHSRGIRPVMVERDEIGGKSRRVVTLNISPSHLDSHRWAVKEEAAEVYRLCLQKVLVEGEELNEETLKVIYKQVEADRVGRESEEAAEAA